MRNKLIIIILLFMLSFIHYYHLNSYIIKEETRLVYPEKRIILNQATPVKSPNLYGKYTCLIDASSGRILTQNHCNQQVPMASTTKIMTCLLALEYGKLEQIVTCSKKASSMPKVHLGMSPGNQFRLNDLLYSLMLMSHNDTAVAIAEHIGGSVEGFAAKMNQRAKKIGMKHTNFVTPNGLDANSHYSTAYDMCLLEKL